MLNIKKLFTKILGHVIVEQGTDGIWTYRKYADGTSECWGSESVSTAFAVWTSPMYYGTTYTTNPSYPTDLFITNPVLNVSMSGADYWLGNSGTPPTRTKPGTYYPVRIGNLANTTYTVCYHAIGKWK